MHSRRDKYISISISIAFCLIPITSFFILHKNSADVKKMPQIFPNIESFQNDNFDYLLPKANADEIYDILCREIENSNHSELFYEIFSKEIIEGKNAFNKKFTNFILKSLFHYRLIINSWNISNTNDLKIGFLFLYQYNPIFEIVLSYEDGKYVLSDFNNLSSYLNILADALLFEQVPEHSKSTEYEIVYDLKTEQPDLKFLEISNTSDQINRFRIVYDNIDFTNSESFISDLSKKYPVDKKENAYMSIFRFVWEYTFHAPDYINQNWTYSPMLMLNSLGGGLCGKRSAVLTNLLKTLELDTRSININNHVVNELKLSDGYKILDPSTGLIFEMGNGRVASYYDIILNKNVLRNSKTSIRSSNDYSEQLIVNESILVDFYSKIFSHRSFETEYHNQKLQDYFEIPPGSSIKFTFKDLTNYPDMGLAILKIPAGYTGKVTTPLVPAAINGKGKVQYQNLIFNPDYFCFTTNIFQRNTISFSFNIIENPEGLIFSYFINPQHYKIKEETELKLIGENIEKIEISIKEFDLQETDFIIPYYIIQGKILRCISDVGGIENQRYSHIETLNNILNCCAKDDLLIELIDFDTLFVKYKNIINEENFEKNYLAPIFENEIIFVSFMHTFFLENMILRNIK